MTDSIIGDLGGDIPQEIYNLEDWESLGAGQHSRQVFLTPLQFDEHSYHESELNFAIGIANKILQTDTARHTFKMFSLDSKDWPKRMKHLNSGSFLENKLFDGEIEILTHPKSEWTQNSVHYGIKIRKSRMTRKNERIISYENYIKKCCSFEFGDNLDIYINPPSDVQEVQSDTLALKKCDESGDNENSDSEEDDEEDSFQKMFKNVSLFN
ncbi:hypothetical protein BpHYR1_043225 [Brachionus plicatilis]|uniref:Uncharacterized protein n=1 Tax=Brachionus plicatilis TaxID=10195 RepID=A0A3M7PUF7_BRAPC|nr:hypothetical protein BpHYR1_043225 [Brachionus plicatilis]